MKQFVLLFRMDIINKEAQPSKEVMATYMRQWMHWINDIEGKGQLADGGNHFSRTGRVLRPKNKITNTPYVAENNSVAGYILVFAKDINDATSIARRCPILNGDNTSVEIRQVEAPGQ